MSFDWIEYIYLAEKLLDKPEESNLRTSISRSYKALKERSQGKTRLLDPIA